MKRQPLDVTLPPRCGRRTRAGLIMPLVLIAMGISMILGLAFLSSASTASATASAGANRLNARMIAESGIAVALDHIETDPSWRVTRPNGTWVTQQALGSGTFSITVEDGDQIDAAGVVIGDGNLNDDLRDPVVITCVGTYNNTRHRVRAVRRVPTPTGIAVDERVTLRKSALIDSYNTAFPYTPATANAKAVASSNGTSKKPYILLRNTSRVNGDVYYGPGGSLIKSVQQDATAVVTGSIGPLPMAVLTPEPVEPVWPGTSAGDRSYSSGVTTITGDTWLDRLTLSGTATLRVVGNVALRVDDVMNVTDDARIQLGYPIAYAAAVKGTVEVMDRAVIDSFDSTLGAYGGANATADAAVATNSTAAASMIVTLGQLRGHAFTGVGSNPKTAIVVAGGQVTGTRAALTAPLVIPAVPAWPASVPANMGNYDVNTGINVISTNLQTDSFKVGGDAVVQVSGNRVIRVNRELALDDTARIEILPGSSLTVYVAEQIRFGGNPGASVNVNTMDASKLVIYGMGAGYQHTIDEDVVACAVIDAPTSSLTVTGRSQFFGTFMGNSITIKADGAFHGDRNAAIPTLFPRLPATFSPGNKLTLYTYQGLTVQRNARINVDAPDPLNMQIYHLAGEPLVVMDTAIGYAQTYLRENTFAISGQAKWTGKMRTRDLTVANTASITADASGGSADPGIVVEETVEVKDAGVLTPVNGTAILASHGATETTIRLEQTAVFKGDAYTAPGGYPAEEIKVGNMATFTGTKGALEVEADVSAPPSPPIVGTPADRVISGMTTVVLTGDVYARHFIVRDDAVIEVDGTARLILTGDFKFQRFAKLRLRPSAKLTVFCPGWVSIQDATQVNLNGNPARLVIACSGTDYVHFVDDDARACATILAPVGELLVDKRAEFFGAYRGKRLIIDKEGKMHCSEEAPVPITWLEQQ